MTLFGKQIAPADLALALAGVLGAICFFWLLPAQHPDSAASYRLGDEQAAQIARAFARQHGAAIPDDARRTVGLQRDAELLEALQRERGRPATVRLLKKSDARERLPAYHWRVEWKKEREEEEDYQTEVRITPGGFVYEFQPPRPASSGAARRVNREALDYALADENTAEGATPLADAPDSLLARHLSFDFSRKNAAARQDTTRHDTTPQDTPPQQRAERAEANALAQRVGGRVFVIPALGREAAVRLARHHLRQTALAGYSFRADSVWIEEQAGGAAATVRLRGGSFHGQRPRVDVTVAATGALRELETEFNPENEVPEDTAQPAQAGAPEGEGGNVNISIEGDTAAGIVTGVLYVILALAAHLVFFRRMNARLVDTQAALRDALWGGLFAAVALGLPAFGALTSADGPEGVWVAVLAIAVTVVFTGAGGAFLIFLASGAMDSVARARWPEQLPALDLVRHGAVRNVPVGAALGRGLAAAGVLLGGTTLLLALLPGAAINFGAAAGTLGRRPFVSPFGYAFAMSGWTGLFVGFTVMLGLGAWLRGRGYSGGVVVPALTAVLTLLQFSCSVPLQPLGRYALVVAFTAGVLAWVFWRFDFIAFFVAYVFAGVLWWTAPGWMASGSPLAVSATLAFVAAGLVLATALAGLFSGKTSTAVPDYVPSYVEELAERERLERDIEIAQQVQRDFLPRRMPQVEGLDVAALCLPAREVGGDYYDFIELEGDRLGVVIGDVSGKGIEASFYMTLAKGFLQTLAAEERSPAQVLRRLNALFCKNAPRGTFITMIYGVADSAAGTFRFARAGHNPLAHHCASQDGGPRTTDGGGPSTGNGRAENERRPTNDGQRTASNEPRTALLRPRGMAIGLADGPQFDDALEEITLPLAVGDALVLYTDGFPEARGPDGTEFGEERIRERIQRHGHRPARDLLQTLADDVHTFVEAAGRHDDMTMVVLKRAQPPAVGPQRSASQSARPAAEG